MNIVLRRHLQAADFDLLAEELDVAVAAGADMVASMAAERAAAAVICFRHWSCISPYNAPTGCLSVLSVRWSIDSGMDNKASF